MENKRISLLFTGAGDPGVISVIKSLKGSYHTVALDMDKYAGGLFFADVGYVVPACTDKSYFKVLEHILEREKVDFIIPTIDEELEEISDFVRKNNKIKALIPEKKFIGICLDKWNLSKELSKNNVPYAKTVNLSIVPSVPKNFFPCIIKPRIGRGSRGFARIKNEKSLEEYLKTTVYKQNQLILQEFLDGTEYTVSVVVDCKGELITVVPKEVVIKEGITRVGVTRMNVQIEDVCKKIVKNFDPKGPFNVQLIVSKKTGKPTIFEINPRFSTTVALTVASGVDEVDLLIKSSLGKHFKVPTFEKDLVMIRYEEQIYVKESKIES